MSWNNPSPKRENRRRTILNKFRRLYRASFKLRRKGEHRAAANRLGLLSSLAVAGISITLSRAGAWRALEYQSYNLLHQVQRELAGAPTWSDQIVVIAIDDASIDQLGYLPWPRQTYADLLDQLSGAQPAAVAFNVFLPESSPQDEPLAHSIVNSANVVLAVGNGSQDRYLDVSPTIAEPAQGFFLKGDAGNDTDEDGISRKIQLHGEYGVPSLSIAALQVYADNLMNTTQANTAFPTPAPFFRRPHRSVFDRFELTWDSKVVRTNFQPEPAEKTYDEQNSALILDAQPATSVLLSAESLMQSWLPAKGPIWLKWPGEVGYPGSSASSSSASNLSASSLSGANASPSTGSLQIHAYADVVNGEVDSSLFQNKIVLVGPTLTGVDTLRTPFQQSNPINGVYFYAATINNLLNQSFLRRPGSEANLLLLCLLAMVGTHFLRRQGVYWRLAVVAGFPLLWATLAYVGFVMGWWLPVAAPIVTIVLSALAVQVQEQQEKQQLMALFSMNVSPGTAELIWRHKGQILDQGELSAQNLTATVLFMDIRGFTSITEALPSQQLLPWLNQYFETMTDCIMEHGGMVDKYIGDAIMAVFGAPVPRTRPEEVCTDAIAALQTAVEMHGRLQRLNQQLTAQNLPNIKFGIGIHTGPLVGGTVGNRHRLNYSLFGDTVNVAARLESLTKSLSPSAPFKVLLSASTYQHTQHHFPLELFRFAQLAGRQGKTEVYSLAAEPISSVDQGTVGLDGSGPDEVSAETVISATAPYNFPKPAPPYH